MVRGTTPVLEFVLPFDTNTLAKAFVTFAQQGIVVLDKPLRDCTCSRNTLSVKLTQEETLPFDYNYLVEIQIRAVTGDEDAIASNIITVGVEKILKDGVI